MLPSLRPLLAALLLTMVPLPRAGAHPFTWLTRRESAIGLQAARIARHGAVPALRWVRAQRDVAQAQHLGNTVLVRFRDGHRLALSFAMPAPTINWPAAVGAFLHAHGAAPVLGARAVILEPFYSQIPAEAAAEPGEVEALREAGFYVDVRRDAQVTVASLEHLARYSMMYLDTHENEWGGGNAIIMTGETNPAPYGPLLQDGSVIPTVVVGQSPPVYYNAVTTGFFLKHVGAFLPHSIAFFNGCSVLQATQLWQVMQEHGLGTLIGWDELLLDTLAVPSGQQVLAHLWEGQTVAQSVAYTTQAGLGISRVNNHVAHLGFRGDGANTLAQAVAGGTQLATVTPAATVTAAPSPTHSRP